MENKIKKALNSITMTYYIMYVAAIFTAFFIYYLNTKSLNYAVSKETSIAVSSLIIIYVIGSIPLSLGGFYWLTKKWIALPSKEERLIKYTKFAKLRLVIIGLGVVIGIIAFYILGESSVIFCAGMSAVALIFCKPSMIKIINELDLDAEENEE